MIRKAAFAAILMAGSSFAAFAQSPKGDWKGDLVTPQITYHIGIHVDQAADGKLTGTIGSHETGRWGTPLEELASTNGELAFRIAAGQSFKGKWDAATSAFTGTYTTPNGAFPFTFTAGKVPPLPTIAGLDGRWEGKLDVQGISLRLVYRVISDEHGTRLLMDSPDQGASGMVTSKLARTGAKVTFDIPAIRANYEGDLSADSATITGTWNQNTQQFPLIMTRTSTNAELPPPLRPQTPRKPYPYKEEELAFDNPKAQGVRLSCTLTSPNTPGRHPAAMLITGSGAQDRDETIFNHKPFLVLADHLTRKGFAILRCDDRGFGKSTGVHLNASAVEFSTDVEAALAVLKQHADIDPKRIGLIGHSEGSMTGPMAASRDPSIAFMVLMGGVAAKGVDLMTEQRTLIVAAAGLSGPALDLARAQTRAVFEASVNAADDAAAREAVRAIFTSAGAPPEAIGPQIDAFASPYMRKILAYDPAPILSQMKMPVLAITGSKDLQVPPGMNLPAMKTIMKENKDLTTVEVPDLNHMFQTAKTGSPSEYAEIEETFAPAALDIIADWMVKRMKP